MAAKGYPGAVEKGTEIRGIADAGRCGTSSSSTPARGRTSRAGSLADGGRVLDVTATGRTIAEAQAKAYAAVDRIDWPEGFCRGDIGWRAVEREPD